MGQGKSALNADGDVTDEALKLLVGTRVVRGPDWKWSGQDGGEGHLGTVRNFNSSREAVVLWDNGKSANYRCRSSFDLRIFDSGPAGIQHIGVLCDECSESPVCGTRWKCSECDDFDLCSKCYHGDKHMEHKFYCIAFPGSTRKLVKARRGSRKVTSLGLLPDACVARGADWMWGSQDGILKQGKITELHDWEDSRPRSGAQVSWALGGKNLYRVGFDGKVDIKVVSDGKGATYYRDHLPPLGMLPPPSNSNTPGLTVGSKVTVELDLETVKALQQEHGGWNDNMMEVLSNTGEVVAVLGDKGIFVTYPSGNRWMLNPAVLSPQGGGQSNNDVESTISFRVGDVVKISSELERVKKLQRGHGEWVDAMILILGKVGKVEGIDGDGDLRVEVIGMTWTLNPLCVSKVMDGLSDILQKLVQLTESNSSTRELIQAAAEKDTQKVERALSQHDVQINDTVGGHTALQIASQNGSIEIMKLLIRKKVDLETTGKGGIRAVHHAAFGGQVAAMKLLAEAGADLNARGDAGETALHVALSKDKFDVIECLITLKAHPSLQDSDGDTPLHIAIIKENDDLVKKLLDAKADIALENKRGFNSLQWAALKGHVGAVRALLTLQQQLRIIDEKKDDGFTALHLAALNNHVEVAELLVKQGKASKDIQNESSQTPLHLAIHGQHFEMVKFLVNEGASVHIMDKDGDTPLHEAVRFHTFHKLKQLQDRPVIELLQQALSLGGSGAEATAAIACYLAAHGAKLTTKNQGGQTPLDLCIDSALSKALEESYVESPSPRPNEGAAPVIIENSIPTPAPVPTTVTTSNVAKAATVAQLARTESNIGPNTSPEECMVCCEIPSDTLFLPCYHLSVCSLCAPRIKKCLICRADVTSKITIEECFVCSDNKSSVLFKPCGHICACNDCAKVMKKCVQCRKPIEEAVNYADLCVYNDSVQVHKSNRFAGDGNVSNAEVSQMKQELLDMKDQMMCPICMDRNRNMAFSCGHCTCQYCGDRVTECPMCRKPIVKRVLLFMQ